MIKTECPYVALLFTADYAPPCAQSQEAFQSFIDEANKDASNKKFEIVVVNCDRTEDEFKANIAKMPSSWFVVPFEATKAVEQLEDLAEAATIPRVTILKPAQSLAEPAIKDIKFTILRNQNMDQAVKDVLAQL